MNILRILTLTSASLSLLGSSLIVWSFLLFPRLRTFPFRLIVFLSVADFFASMSYVIGQAMSKRGTSCNAEFACYLSATMSQFFDVATFLWTAVIAHNVYSVLVKGTSTRTGSVEVWETWYHRVTWGVALVALLASASVGSFGDSGLWCWIQEDYRLTQIFCYYLILIFVFIFNTAVFVRVYRHLRMDPSASLTSSTVTYRLLAYLLVFFVLRIWSVVDRINDFATNDEHNFGLGVVRAIATPLQGFCNAIVYGMTRSVLEEWYGGLSRLREKWHGGFTTLVSSARIELMELRAAKPGSPRSDHNQRLHPTDRNNDETFSELPPIRF